MHPVLAIDHGTARIGLAATDPLGIAAHPVATLSGGDEEVLERLGEIIRERGIRHLVLGLPLRMDGSEGDAAARVRTFGDRLAARFPDLPLSYADERLSTVAAAEKLHAAGRKAKHQKDLIDQAAAVEILHAWLDEQDPGSAPTEPPA